VLFCVLLLVRELCAVAFDLVAWAILFAVQLFCSASFLVTSPPPPPDLGKHSLGSLTASIPLLSNPCDREVFSKTGTSSCYIRFFRFIFTFFFFFFLLFFFVS